MSYPARAEGLVNMDSLQRNSLTNNLLFRTFDRRVLISLQRSSRCILQPQPTGQIFFFFTTTDGEKLDGNNTRLLQATLNKSWRQHPTKQHLYGHLPPIPKTIKIRRTRHAGHCWRSRDELISDVLPWTLSNGRAKAGRPARTYIQQLCEDTECSP